MQFKKQKSYFRNISKKNTVQVLILVGKGGGIEELLMADVNINLRG